MVQILAETLRAESPARLVVHDEPGRVRAQSTKRPQRVARPGIDRPVTGRGDGLRHELVVAPSVCDLHDRHEGEFVETQRATGLPSRIARSDRPASWSGEVERSRRRRRATATGSVYDFLWPFFDPYDTAVFTMPGFVPPEFPIRNVRIIPPASDPRARRTSAFPTIAAWKRASLPCNRRLAPAAWFGAESSAL